MNAMHARWGKCPREDKTIFTGKEGFPNRPVAAAVNMGEITKHLDLHSKSTFFIISPSMAPYRPYAYAYAQQKTRPVPSARNSQSKL